MHLTTDQAVASLNLAEVTRARLLRILAFFVSNLQQLSHYRPSSTEYNRDLVSEFILRFTHVFYSFETALKEINNLFNYRPNLMKIGSKLTAL